MDIRLITSHPWWMLIVCLLIGFTTAYFIYFSRKGNEFSKLQRIMLFAIRFAGVSILSFLLLSPMIRTNRKTIIKPSVIIGIDNSSSIVMNSDSTYFRTECLNEIENLKKSLKDDYDVKTYTFGDRVESDKAPEYDNASTDIASLFREINSRYYNRNLGAVILASDGIYNKGYDPLYDARNIKVPVYTVNLGDTSSRKDLLIKKVNHNKTAIKGNRFPVEVTLQAVGLAGSNTKVTIYDGNKSLYTAPVEINSNNQIINIPALLLADTAGIKKIRIQADKILNEINPSNNSRDIFVDIIENRLKIALVTDAPHPDIASLQRVVNESNNFEMSVVKSVDLTLNNLNDYDLIILYQLPALRNPFKSQIDNIISRNIPILYIMGAQTNVPLFNSLKTGLMMNNFKGSFSESLPVINASFSSFLITDSQKKLLEQVPPLTSSFASYNIANSVNVFLSQKIGTTLTSLPLICFNETLENRVGVITGEGIWKWRMVDYLQNNTHSNFDDLVKSIFQYLTSQSDKSKFRIEWKNFYAENENIELSAILLNDSYQPLPGQEITFEIIDESDKKYNYVFAQDNDSYRLRIGILKPGIYSFTARASLPGADYIKNGSFVVTKVNLEDINLLANHNLLNNISKESGGISVYPNQINAITHELIKREEIKPLALFHQQYTSLIDYYPLMILLFVLFGIEWFIRKYTGSY